MENIQIICHECGQKFSVSNSYMGRMVECGTCEEVFEVTEESLAKKRKVYPGEKSKSPNNTFTKATPVTNDVSANFQTASYNNVNANYVQPLGPTKTLMIASGIIIILIFIIIFLIGGQEDGVLKELDNTKRLILAGFIAFIGSALIIIGFRNKLKGLLTSFLLGGSLAAMPTFFPEVLSTTNLDPSVPLSPTHTTQQLNQANEISVDQLEAYKKGIGYDRIEELRNKALDPNQVKAILLLENKVQYLDSILPYLERVLSLDSTPVTSSYGREIDGKPVTLMTMTTDTSFEELYELTKRFGTPTEMNNIQSTLKIIIVTVDKSTLTPPPEGVTLDPLNPQYFNVNYKELKSIDRTRQMNAAKRLESGEYLGRQADISKLLAELITPKDHELSAQLIATLNNWSRPEYKIDDKVVNYARTVAGTRNMTRSVMDYLIDKKVPNIADILSKQWASKGGSLWANYLIEAGEQGEEATIKALPNLGNSHYKSASAILSKIGTSRSIAFINSAISKANEENKKYLKATIDEIKSRQ